MVLTVVFSTPTYVYMANHSRILKLFKQHLIFREYLLSKIRIKGTNYMNGTNGVNVAKGANGTNGILGVIFDVDGTIHSGHSNELILRDNNGRSEQLAEIDGMFYRR